MLTAKAKNSTARASASLDPGETAVLRKVLETSSHYYKLKGFDCSG